MARVDAVEANIENALAKVPQASSESCTHHTSEEAAVTDAEIHADHAVEETMEPLRHEIPERELEMWEPSESDERSDELLLAREEVEKRVSVKESAVEY
ncbi:hypothetical protein D1007_47211 [Hordeum vulgare]|nr:hypothetical protein D1007_47211 [Hordeum vulgare]